MKLIRVIEIEDELYGEAEIKAMSFEEVKMLISFIEKESELIYIKNWRQDCIHTESYINNLLSKL